MMPQADFFLESFVQKLLDNECKLNFLFIENYAFNIDYPWDILNANRKLNQHYCSNLRNNFFGKGSFVSSKAIVRGKLKMGINSSIGDNVILQGNVIVGDNTKITDGAIIGENTVIGDQCEIKEYCKIFPNSTVGNRSIIAHNAELEGIILENTYLYHYCEIFGILGQSVDVGAGTTFGTLRFDDNKVTHKIGTKYITPSKFDNAIYIGDFSRTGVNSSIMPGVKVGCRSVVSSNVCLLNDLQSQKILSLKQETVERDWGCDKYGY